MGAVLGAVVGFGTVGVEFVFEIGFSVLQLTIKRKKKKVTIILNWFFIILKLRMIHF
jgi:hypothetical protein